jgi:transposase
MLTEALVPRSGAFKLEDVSIEDGMVKLTIHCLRSGAMCPKCGQSSERVHSRYWRTVADLPCSEHRVQLHLMVRRFFCGNRYCTRRTFARTIPKHRQFACQAHESSGSQATPGWFGARW